MDKWGKIRAKRLKAQAKGLRNMTAEQREAVNVAQDAIRSFVSEWTESFDIYDPDTPRKLQSAFYKLQNAFQIDDV
jgi:hypothetical protein